MKIAFILLICLSFFGCSKEQKTETVPQNNEVQESMSIEQPMGIEEITQIEEEPHQTEENKLASEAFEKYRLVVSIEGERRSSALFVEFLDENTYCFCSPFGGYLWSDLAYTASEDTLSFSKFSYKNPFNIDELNELFSVDDGNQFVDFVYDENFCTFDYKGGYRNGKVLLTDGQTKTPDGTVCYIGDIQVVKKSGHLVPIENLKLREEPSANAQTGSINYAYELWGMRAEEYRHSNGFNENYILAAEDFYDEKNELSILLAGMIKNFDAVTVEQDTIDGITAPWYRICVDSEEMSISYWIFGGYIKEIDNPQTKEYEQLLFDAAVQNGLLVPRAVIEKEQEKLLNQATIIHNVGQALYLKRGEIQRNADATKEKPGYYTIYYFHENSYYSTVVEFVNNDLLQDSQIKIGMAKQDILDLWGEPHEEINSTLEYNSHELSEGFGYEITVTLKNDRVTKIVCYMEK
ncbi:MAG: hypothetical protein IJX45_04400 [Spirochaetaceae bacterium]|nr:hypothetical protein [Spirochaetaceae bacterium]